MGGYAVSVGESPEKCTTPPRSLEPMGWARMQSSTASSASRASNRTMSFSASSVSSASAGSILRQRSGGNVEASVDALYETGRGRKSELACLTVSA